MSFFWGTQTISSGVKVPVNVNAGDGTSCLLIGNESGLTVKVTLDGTGSSKSLYPGWVDVFDIPSRGWNGIIILEPSTMLSNSASWPSSYVQIDVFGIGERPSGTYPVALPRLNNIGNNVTTNMGSSTSLQNDNNAASTQFIEATVSGSPSSNVSIDNSGNAFIAQTVAGVVTKLFQTVANAATSVLLGATGKITEIVGSLTVDQSMTVTGDATFNGAGNGITVTNNALVSGNETISGTLAVTGTSTLTGAVTATNAGNNIQATTLQGGANVPAGRIGRAADGDILDGNSSSDTYLKAGSIVHVQTPSGTDVATFDTNGINVAPNKQLKWLAGTTSRLNAVSASVGSGTSVAHGLGTTPFAAWLAVNISQPGSATLGVGSIGATNVTCTQGAGGSLTCYLLTIKG